MWQLENGVEQLWMKIIKAKYLNSNENLRILTIQNLIKGSTIWNFILSCRHVITDHISWVIGNDNKDKFWEDSWNGYKYVEEEYGDENLKKLLCDRWGCNVRNYITEVDGVLGKRWQWKG